MINLIKLNIDLINFTTIIKTKNLLIRSGWNVGRDGPVRTSPSRSSSLHRPPLQLRPFDRRQNVRRQKVRRQNVRRQKVQRQFGGRRFDRSSVGRKVSFVEAATVFVRHDERRPPSRLHSGKHFTACFECFFSALTTNTNNLPNLLLYINIKMVLKESSEKWCNYIIANYIYKMF